MRPPTTHSRREALLGAGALSLLPALARAAAGPRAVAGFDPSRSPSASTLADWMRQLHGFGPVRATGTPPARAFEDWLDARLRGLGFEVERRPYRLTSWECALEDCGLTLTEDGKPAEPLDVLGYYPFAASTKSAGPIVGRVLHAGSGDEAIQALIDKTDARALAESIVVVDIALMGAGGQAPRFYPAAFPDDLPPRLADPPPSASGRVAMEALEGRVKGLVLCCADLPDEAFRFNGLPVGDQHRKTPALWVGGATGRRLKAVSGAAGLELRCEATLTPEARSDTLIGLLPGASDETVLLVSHTDGPNEINENGALGALACAMHQARAPQRRRALAVAFSTGQYAAGAVADPITGSGQPPGLRGVMQSRPELIARTVGCLSLERLGAVEWRDLRGRWRSARGPAPEMWLPTAALAPELAELFRASTRGADPRFSRAGLVESGFPAGDGGPLRAAGVPGLGLVGAPSYAFRCDPKGVIDKFDARIMKNQVDMATRLAVLMDRLSVDQLRGRTPVTEGDLFA